MLGSAMAEAGRIAEELERAAELYAKLLEIEKHSAWSKKVGIDPTIGEPEESDIVTMEPKMALDKWAALVETYNEAHAEYISDNDSSLVLKKDVSLRCKMDKGWRSRAFYTGSKFLIGSARVGKKEGILFQINPSPLTSEFQRDGFMFGEVKLLQASSIFGVEFDQFFNKVMGMTVDEALKVVSRKTAPGAIAAPAPEVPAGWGDW
jgi:hypothetical protein